MTDTRAGVAAPDRDAVRERPAFAPNGLVGGGLGLAMVLGGPVAGTVIQPEEIAAVLTVLLVLAGLITLRGLVTVSPGQAKVLQFLGRYVGTLRRAGLYWVNPLTTRKSVSTRIRNHESAVLKVNDADGNPIEIAAVVVWQVEDTAQAVFDVDDFVTFVQVQTETAVRHIANSYPYDAHGADDLSLRENAVEITERLSAEIADRVAAAGVRVIESRITHLAYAPEIAQVMLQRQQASAVVAARARIVEGAVGMVEMALDRLAERDVVDLDEERKAAMVSNLLVVLCGDRSTQPVVNTGSLYH
ncbi:SPFH domain / Band 7 family protein [Streptoalloteichus tenebrarius]|uniref:SPFH domain / Band 7 family protein n=1 Tax=Streptoalloteichus tenebrarius (strain ATCC 17920 / DSM 40477 / JCM 4838 / CBS 697.72 / NBRC 16177 / NCIMB 11028 / NRRL B-12390 / A12253. 1 / ISP 5477) TaxID=1933 RepID=A0ABT1HZ77_STRSD|nr:SPFH domain-containing protein [Streptoalloteichus tenebrarius]MCP2260816.1 SPFH domain / Band 7 family protein [Streptoalloteichus tenebrarius]BFF00510.1 SPFH domain-containing protein [Streptoalloteichus tenebrarius]